MWADIAWISCGVAIGLIAGYMWLVSYLKRWWR